MQKPLVNKVPKISNTKDKEVEEEEEAAVVAVEGVAVEDMTADMVEEVATTEGMVAEVDMEAKVVKEDMVEMEATKRSNMIIMENGTILTFKGEDKEEEVDTKVKDQSPMKTLKSTMKMKGSVCQEATIEEEEAEEVVEREEIEETTTRRKNEPFLLLLNSN